MRDFAEAPFLVNWGTAQACNLLCEHCRASAQPARDPGELSTDEAMALLRQVKSLGDSLMVFTGGDPREPGDYLASHPRRTCIPIQSLTGARAM
ncbi:MAG TPA: hypothetical protein PLZ95_00465 [Bryobacteraceae bacterium]|nr:hypothetical protein [Bryobacteraceae bacterium]